MLVVRVTDNQGYEVTHMVRKCCHYNLQDWLPTKIVHILKGDSAKCRHETTSNAALYMNVPRCALGICIVIKLSPPSLIRQHRRIPSRRQSASRLPSPRRTTNTPFRAISSERERERGRARSGWGCVTPCLPLTDGRTDGGTDRRRAF